MTNQQFSPCYTWPNEAFPFRLYLDHPNARIFIIENIFHNYKWLNACSEGIRDTDIFLVILGWHHGDWHAWHSKECIKACGLNIDTFIILCNDYSDYVIFSAYGFTCRVINQNCFLDHALFCPEESTEKIYDAVYVARFTPFKRHDLANEVANLALVSGNLHGGSAATFIPNHVYKNDRQLNPREVQEVICHSKVGLILSEIEGACFASSEYLLCGIPVVSTTSKGGRSIWYNDYNSIICDATPHAVADAVLQLIKKAPSPSKIREHHLILARRFRDEFIDLLGTLFSEHKISLEPSHYFIENYFHKMRHSVKPDFFKLFQVVIP